MARSLHRLIKIEADSQGNAPITIELLRVGSWNTPWHGEFEITPADIQEFVVNGEKGIGLVEADKKIPVNYGHDMGGKAAAWIPKLYASEDGFALLGDPEWTPAALQALRDGEWKYISPEFNPRDFPWEDPEQEYSFVNNVLTGAALTNIPLFKKLKPVMASAAKPPIAGSSGKRNKEGDHMDLVQVRAKKPEELNEEEKTFLEEHKAELTAEERQAFSLETAEEKTAREQTEKEEKERQDAADEKAKLEASRTGQVVLSADELNRLKADAQSGVEARKILAQKEASEFATAAIKAGRIKSDQKDATVKLLLASTGKDREALEAFINGLPEDSRLKANELGDTGDVAGSATDELMRRAGEAVKASDGKVTLSDATKEVLNNDADLNARINAERNVKA